MEKNEGYARFKGTSIQGKIKEVLSRDPLREDIVGLGFLLHLYALKLRLAMYKNLIPFTMLNFKKDLQEIINTLHAFRHLSCGSQGYSVVRPEWGAPARDSAKS